MEITLNFGDSEILEKIASKFGNSAHILVPKELAGKTAKIITGECKISKSKISADFAKTEILERKVSVFGTGAHLIVPGSYSSKKITVIIGGKHE